jgi:pimeloyl-ACP methyl ester carboxylesterase
LSVDAQGAGDLAALKGARPPAPAWFDAALTRTPERTRIRVEGAEIEVLAWGGRGDPGLLFLHGNGAHADWWSPIAPWFADAGYRVAAVSFSGMGGSDWRPTYNERTFIAEAIAAAEHAGLFDTAVKPIVAAHSFGGFIALTMAASHGDLFSGVVTVDTPVRPANYPHQGPPDRSRSNRIYDSFEATLARFRLAPLQSCANPWYLDHVGRGSIKAVESGFTWKFDPFVLRDFRFDDRTPLLQGVRCPVALMWGDRSGLIPPDVAAYMRASAPKGAPVVVIPDADHQVMLDQPLPFVAALRGLLAAWPGGEDVAASRGAV